MAAGVIFSRKKRNAFASSSSLLKPGRLFVGFIVAYPRIMNTTGALMHFRRNACWTRERGRIGFSMALAPANGSRGDNRSGKFGPNSDNFQICRRQNPSSARDDATLVFLRFPLRLSGRRSSLSLVVRDIPGILFVWILQLNRLLSWQPSLPRGIKMTPIAYSGNFFKLI